MVENSVLFYFSAMEKQLRRLETLRSKLEGHYVKDFIVESEIVLEETELKQDISSFGVMVKAVEEAGNLDEVNEKVHLHAGFSVS